MSDKDHKPEKNSRLFVDPPPPPGEPENPKRPIVKRKELAEEDYVAGIREGNRGVLARAITLAESNRPEHIDLARRVLTSVMDLTGKAYRVGITGVPGAGKSTFIESFGKTLTAGGHKVAVLAIDPSSGLTGGSILGDKTRMAELGTDPNAFIRPSPSAGTLGGVAAKTRETMLLCEAAGFDVVLIETVGVGQSETVVADMTDFFLTLMIAGAGDELQGIKRGILEFADLIAVNKADGDNVQKAKLAASEYEHAMRFMQKRHGIWVPPVVTCSALVRAGLTEIWNQILEHRQQMEQANLFESRRKEQMLRWMWMQVNEQLQIRLTEHPDVQKILNSLEDNVRGGHVPPTAAADQLIQAFLSLPPR